ncbi:hypothetical protein ACHQM5_010914 [Ranunculus cassubicifolius]
MGFLLGYWIQTISPTVLLGRRLTLKSFFPKTLESPLNHSSSFSPLFSPTSLNSFSQILHPGTKMALEELDQDREAERERRKIRLKRRLLREAENAENRGVCYFSRIPPRMDPIKFRRIISEYGEIDRIWLTPENPAAQLHRKRAGGFRGQNFSEGWVEFLSKSVAKRVANALNGEQIGGKRKSQFYYDQWNIKYLSKFKWDDLTEEIAYKMATREQKLALEISAATRERDFYLKKVDKARALTSIEDRMKKKQKIPETPDNQTEQKVIRHFPQTQPVSDTLSQSKPTLSKEVLAGVFGAGSY